MKKVLAYNRCDSAAASASSEHAVDASAAASASSGVIVADASAAASASSEHRLQMQLPHQV